MKIFLSYSSKDYELAKEIKSVLENCGLDVFLAHTSIEPTKEWVKEIHKNLKECDIFMPILTNNFRESNWTDQESGVAFNENKKILSLKVDMNPYGFLGQFQALNFNLASITYELTKFEKKLEIIKALMIDFPDEIRKKFIFSLDKTYCYRLGTAKCRFLKELEKEREFNKEEINEILRAMPENNQLFEASEIKPYRRELVEKYVDEIEPVLKKEIMTEIKDEKAREMLGGKSLHSSFLTEKQEEKAPSLVDGLKKHL